MHPEVEKASLVIPATDQGPKNRGKAKACENWAREQEGLKAGRRWCLGLDQMF